MRAWYVTEALTSVRRLSEILREMTDEEIQEVISLEESARRRDALLTKLYRELRVRARQKFVRS